MAENATQQKIVIDERIGRIFKQQAQNAGVRDAARAYRAIVSLIAGDGDFTDIQSAINYVNTLGGGTILIRIGEYVMTDDITMYDNIHLYGEDRDNTIINFNNGTKHIVNTSLTNIRIENLTIDNCRSTTGSIYIYQCTNIYIFNVTFINNSTGAGAAYDIFTDTVGLGINGTIIIERCYSSGSDHFVGANSLVNASRIADNYILNCQSTIILGAASTGRALHITGNYITGNKGSFIDGTAGNEFFEAVVDKNKIVTPNDSQTGWCINVVGTISILENDIGGHGGGIKISNGDIARINSNTIGAGGGEAIWLNGESRVEIVGNRITQGDNPSSYAAVKISNSAFSVHLVGNTIESSDDGTFPAVLLDTTAGGIEIVGNKISAGSIGVSLSASSNNQITGNQIQASSTGGTGSTGVKIDSNSDYNQVVGNRISGTLTGTGYGIDIANANCDGNIVIGNRLTGNTAASHDLGTASVLANNN